MPGLLEALMGSPAGSPVRGLMAQYQMLNPSLPPQAVAQQIAPAQRRGDIDAATQQYIDLFNRVQGPALTPSVAAINARTYLPDDVALRNADHYLFAKEMGFGPALLGLTPGYLAWKMLTEPRSARPDPWGQLKWGLKPAFSLPDFQTIPKAARAVQAHFQDREEP